MLLSTSSSDERLPEGPWGRTWALALVILVLGIGGWEVLWRVRGFKPSFNDDVTLWLLARGQVKVKDPDASVIIGGSRAQLDLVPWSFGATLGGDSPVQLSINGTSPRPLLRHLAEETEFRGIVISSVNPMLFFGASPDRDATVGEYIQAHRDQTALQPLENWLSVTAQGFFVFRRTALAPRQVLTTMVRGEGIRPPYIKTAKDRTRVAHYARFRGLQRHRERQRKRYESAGPPLPREAWLSDVKGSVEKIHERGGLVVFVRLPSTGPVLAAEKRRYPGEEFWDVLVSETGAYCIHFEDHKALSAVPCPDDTHLDGADAVPFSLVIAEILRQEFPDRFAHREKRASRH